MSNQTHSPGVHYKTLGYWLDCFLVFFHWFILNHILKWNVGKIERLWTKKSSTFGHVRPQVQHTQSLVVETFRKFFFVSSPVQFWFLFGSVFSFSVSPDTSCVVQGFNSNRWAAGYGSRPVVDSPHTHTHIFFWKKKKKKTEKNRRPKGGWERRKCYCTTFPPSSSPSPADTSAIIKMEDERIKKEGVYFIFLLLLLLPLLSVTANRFYFLFSRKIHMI